ncbi:discoidin domain-containing protein [Nocardia sp. NPDC051463]|uniref:discoidin domain-containing protein n=1 Tax=Nocardia sp. NPDC051463 TaxID=3154845 RepID=UPI003432203D
MSDQDPGDIFLRHRGAVLATLLSDPEFGTSEADLSADNGSGGSEFDQPDSIGHASAPAEFESELSAPVQRLRSVDGPKASERILALLNGQSTESVSSMDYAQDFSESANATASGPSESDEPPKPASGDRPGSSASNRFGSVDGQLRGVLVQLRKPRVALAIGAVVAVLLVLLLITTGGDDPQERDRVLVITPPPTTAAPATPSTAAAAGSTITVKSAQSKCPPGSTSAMDAFGGQAGKAWSCVRAFKVDGQVLTIELGKTYQIDSIAIVPGWDYIAPDGTDQWSKFRTVSRVSYLFDDGKATTYTQPTLDQRTLVTTKIDPPVSASKIVLTVLESKGEPAINTTAISSVVVTGH